MPSRTPRIEAAQRRVIEAARAVNRILGAASSPVACELRDALDALDAAERAGGEEPCPHPARNGLHEWYTFEPFEYAVCKACGARRRNGD